MRIGKWIRLLSLLGLLLPWACGEPEETPKAKQGPETQTPAVTAEVPGQAPTEGAEEAEAAGLRDMGKPCDQHAYLLEAGQEATLAFSFLLGPRDPGVLSFEITASDVAGEGLNFSVADVDVVSLEHPAWVIDASASLSVPQPFPQVSARGFTIFWGTDGTGVVMLHGKGLLGTGLMEGEAVKARITAAEGALSVKTPGSGQAVQIPVELEQSEATSYFAVVEIAATMPDRTDFHYAPGKPRYVTFRGSDETRFRLTISRLSDTAPFQIIGPDIRPDCYKVE